MVAQVIQGHTVQIPADVFRMGDFSAAKFLERRDGGVLENVRRDLRIPHASQDQGAQAGIVAIDCRQVRNRIGYWLGDVRFRGK